MEPLSFEICHADGRQERTSAQGARIVIGSGAHCDVRLAADQAAFEHVAIEELTTGPQIRNLAPALAATLDGDAFSSRALGPSALVCLCIGNTQIRIVREVRAAAVKSTAPGPVMISKGCRAWSASTPQSNCVSPRTHSTGMLRRIRRTPAVPRSSTPNPIAVTVGTKCGRARYAASTAGRAGLATVAGTSVAIWTIARSGTQPLVSGAAMIFETTKLGAPGAA